MNSCEREILKKFENLKRFEESLKYVNDNSVNPRIDFGGGVPSVWMCSDSHEYQKVRNLFREHFEREIRDANSFFQNIRHRNCCRKSCVCPLCYINNV